MQITSAYKELRSSENPEVSLTYLELSISYSIQKSYSLEKYIELKFCCVGFRLKDGIFENNFKQSFKSGTNI